MDKPACGSQPDAFFAPTDVSGDGQILVGYCSASPAPSAQPVTLAFRWSRAGGYVQLLPQGSTTARTSYYGTVTAGTGTGLDRFGAAQHIPIVWRSSSASAPGSAETLADAKGAAVAVSGDGSFAVGNALGNGPTRWRSQTSFTLFPVPAGATFCSVEDTSRNASVTIGICDTTRAAIWYDTGVTTTLDPISGTSSFIGLRLSADGAVVAGLARDFISRAGLSYAFRWTAASGPVVLDPKGDSASVNDVSADGALIVGTRFDPSQVTSARAVVWDSAGRHDLDAVLTSSGADLGSWSLESVAAIADDGGLVVGVAYNNHHLDESRPYLAHLFNY